MKVLRKQEVETASIQVGDQIIVPLDGMGEFTATAHKIGVGAILFIFDEIIAKRPMNETNTNEGGFKNSQLYKWLQNTLLPAFPEELRSNIREVTIPTVGQITGWGDQWDRENLTPDGDEQLPLMKERKHRVATYKDGLMWYWLQNTTKSECSSASFANVDCDGNSNYLSASYSGGVRPAFWLVKRESRGPVPQSKDPLYLLMKEMFEGISAGASSRHSENKKKEEYDEAARDIKAIMDSFVYAGFSEAQSFDIVKILLAANFGGNR